MNNRIDFFEVFLWKTPLSYLGRCETLMDLKRLKKQNREEEDIISRLPDDVLCHILSCLPTRDAVRTSILSSRWKNVWTSIYNLCLDDTSFSSNNQTWESMHFVNFVDQALSLWQSKAVNSFQLTCHYYIPDRKLFRVTAWIHSAIQHNVRKLIIDRRSGRGRILTLPQSILSCKTLVELRLHTRFVLEIPDSVVCFPSLKILHVQVNNPNGDIMNKFFGSCPVLEVLSIYGYLEPGDNVQTFNIMMPTLKRLSISVIVMYEYVSEHKFVIRAQDLEYFNVSVNTLPFFVVNELPSLCEALVNFRTRDLREPFGVNRNEAIRAMELVREIKNTKSLSLSYFPTTALGLAFDDGSLPIFPNLIRLELQIESCFGWKLLSHFLNNSPNLEVLVLDIEKIYNPNLSTEDNVVRDFDSVESKSVPCCLSLKVKVIKIKTRQNIEPELEVVRYLLKYSEVLEKFEMGFYFFAPKEDLRKEILMFPRGSNTCKIEFV